MSKEDKDRTLWCPHGRVSIQRFDGGIFKEAVPGGYNMVNVTDLKAGQAPSTQLVPATPCIKHNCAVFKKGIFPWSYGRCGLAKSNPGPWILAAVFIAEIVAIAATVIFQHV